MHSGPAVPREGLARSFAGGNTAADIVCDYPYLEEGDVTATLEYAAGEAGFPLNPGTTVLSSCQALARDSSELRASREREEASPRVSLARTWGRLLVAQPDSLRVAPLP